jgi:hypothetical protein
MQVRVGIFSSVRCVSSPAQWRSWICRVCNNKNATCHSRARSQKHRFGSLQGSRQQETKFERPEYFRGELLVTPRRTSEMIRSVKSSALWYSSDRGFSRTETFGWEVDLLF